MARVPAHTNEPGYHVLKAGTQIRIRKPPGIETSWGAPEISTSAIAARCYKSVPINGPFSSLLQKYRLSTPFTRVVIRASSGAALFKKYYTTGSSAFWTIQEDALYNCSYLGDGPWGASASKGLVNVGSFLNGSEQDAASAVYNMAADFGEALVELKGTCSAVKGILLDLGRSLLALLRRNWKELARIFRKRFGKDRIPGTYLEWVYAVKPIAQTVHQLLDSTNQIEKFGKPIKVQRDRTSAAPVDPLYPSRPVDGMGVARSRTTFVVVYENSWARWISRNGFSPIDVLWAITPYSFVVDWFIPISDWLHRLQVDNSVRMVDGYRSELTYGEGTVQLHTYTYGVGPYDGDRPKTTIRAIGFRRTPVFLNGLRLPAASAGVINGNQLFSLGAMIVQALQRT